MATQKTINQTTAGLRGFLNMSDDELFARQERYGKSIYIIAWVVEIIAAIAGLFIAVTLALQAYDALPPAERENSAMVRAFGGVLPFVIIAVIEPTKIFLASGLYHAKPALWKALFGFGLLALTLVTFETIFNGLVQQNVNVTFETQAIQNDRSRIDDEIEQVEYRIHEFEQKSPEAIAQSFDEPINVANSNFEERKQNLEQSKDQKLANIDTQINDLRERTLPDREKISQSINEMDLKISDIHNRYDGLISTQHTERDKLRNDRIRELEQAGGIFGGNRRSDINEKYDARENRVEQNILSLKQERKDEVKEPQKQRDVLQSQLNGLNLNNPVARREITKLETQKKEVQTDYGQQLSEIEVNHKNEVDALTAERDKAHNQVFVDKEKIPALKEQQDELIAKKAMLKDQYRRKASQLQIIQLSKMVCGYFYNWCFENRLNNDDTSSVKFDIADLPEEKIATVGNIWFASIAAISATIGSFLALTSFVLRDPKAYKAEGSRTFRVLVENTGEGLKQTGYGLRSLFERTGNALGFMFEAIGNCFKIIGRSFRKLSLDFRRYWRTPKIKFERVEVEKIVEKRVEVPVDKIVYKEVPKEIIRKEIVYVPLYSADNGTFNLEPGEISDLMPFGKSKTEKEDKGEGDEPESDTK